MKKTPLTRVEDLRHALSRLARDGVLGEAGTDMATSRALDDVAIAAAELSVLAAYSRTSSGKVVDRRVALVVRRVRRALGYTYP